MPNSELRQGIDFADDAIVRACLSSASQPPALLFPGNDAKDIRVHPPAGPISLFVLDGTWSQASKLLKSNPALQSLPRYGLLPDHPSRYRIRREPADHCVATIEALAQVLGVLENDPDRMSRLLLPFDAMVEFQVALALANPTSRYHPQPATRLRKPNPIPAVFVDDPKRLVLMSVETNEWPRNSFRPPAELVHVVAQRLGTSDRFEAIVRPQSPVASSCPYHLGIEREAIEQGETFDAFAGRWRAFARADDVVCMWGHYGGDVLEQSALALGTRINVRTVTLKVIGSRAGSVDAYARALGMPVGQPWAQGRAGARLAALVSVVQGLMGGRGGRAPSP